MPSQIKIAFFDIDGTILDLGAADLHQPVKEALQTLQKNGIRIFAATGRPPYTVPHFEGIRFDGHLCFNGAYCADRQQVIHICTLDKKDIRTVVKNASRLGLATQIASVDRMGCNRYQAELERYIKLSRHPVEILPDFDAVLEEDICQLMIAAGPEMDNLLLEGTKTVKLARWCDWAADVIAADCGKAVGIRKILEYYGWTPEAAIAFGDGGNDADMIEYAGIGVAMGNARQEVKAAADYITDTCEKDGVIQALRHFGLL